MSQNIGKIISAKGPVIDIQFDGDKNLPALNTAIEIQNGDELLVVEVAQHIGDDVVRCVAMGPTDGVKEEWMLLILEIQFLYLLAMTH